MKNETARRLALTAAGKPPPVDYSLDGESFSFTGWLAAMTAKIKDLNELIASLDIGEAVLHGWN